MNDDFELDIPIEELLEETEQVYDNRPVARHNYKNIKRGDRLDIMTSGPDWLGIKHCGNVFRIPKWVL